MKRLILSVGFLLALVCSTDTLKATHMMGADVSYECINPCTIRVHLRAYRDCTGSSFISPPTDPWNVAATSPGGCTDPIAVGAWSAQVTTEVTPICPGMTTCCDPGAPVGCPLAGSGMLRGVEEYYWWRDYNICGAGAAPCIFYFSWTYCCRNDSISTISSPGSQSLHISATTLNTTLPGCNSSPAFANPPVPYICSGQSFTFNQGAFDPEGDSLAYRLGPCYDDGPPLSAYVTLPYLAGVTPTAPLGPGWSVTIDPFTGDITFTPTPGPKVVAVMCVYVEEWRGGVKINEIVRDMQITVISCPLNTLPTMAGVTGITGGVIDGPYEVTTCAGTTISFNMPAVDPDPGQVITMYWNENLKPDGGVFHQSGLPAVIDSFWSSPAPSGTFTWTPLTPGVYTFLVTVRDDACPILGQNQYTIVINVIGGLPSSSATVVPIGCVDISLNASPGAGGTGPFTYQWTGDGNLDINPLNNTSVFNHTYPGPGTYWWEVTITDAYGCTSVISGTVNIPAGPTADCGPDISLCSGFPVLIGTAALPGQTYNWFPGTSLSSTTSAQPTFNHTVVDGDPDTLNYVLTASNGPCVAVDYLTVVVYPIPSASISGPLEICIGDAATLTATGGTSYLWNTGETTASINVSPAVTSTYTATVIENGCASLPVSHTVTVSTGPTAIIMGPDSVCPGDDALITVVGGTNWVWSTGATTQTITIPNINSSVTVTVIPGIGTCFGAPVSHTVHLYNRPVADFSSTEVCFQNTTSFNDLSNLTPGTVVDWKWTFGDAASGAANFSSTQNPTHVFSAPGTYNVILIVTGSNGCKDTVNHPVIVNPLPTANFDFQDVCIDEVMSFVDLSTPGAGIVDWQWNFGDGGTSTIKNPTHTYTAPGPYNVTLTITDNKGCSASVVRTVFVFPKAVPYFTWEFECFNQITLFTNGSTLTDPYGTTMDAYSWNFGDPTSGVENTSTNPNPTHNFTTPGTYYVTLTVTTSRGCTSSATIEVVVAEVMPIIAINDSICPGYSGSLQVTGVWTDAIAEWYTTQYGDEMIMTGNYFNTPPLNTTTTYWVGMLDVDGCRSARTPVTCYVYQGAGYTVDFSSQQLEIPNAILEIITTFYYNPGIVSWVWDFGDGTTSTEISPIHQYDKPGVYTIKLTIVDANGCEYGSTWESWIFVEQQIAVWVPNAFTPNGDFINDEFKVESRLIKEFNIQIYDRWGQMMFTSQDLNFNWRGVDTKGISAPEGVYTYVISGKAIDNTPISQAGTVLLTR